MTADAIVARLIADRLIVNPDPQIVDHGSPIVDPDSGLRIGIQAIMGLGIERFVNSLSGRRDDRLLTIEDGPVRTVDGCGWT